jgi:hypothetical protein
MSHNITTQQYCIQTCDETNCCNARLVKSEQDCCTAVISTNIRLVLINFLLSKLIVMYFSQLLTLKSTSVSHSNVHSASNNPNIGITAKQLQGKTYNISLLLFVKKFETNIKYHEQ